MDVIRDSLYSKGAFADIDGSMTKGAITPHFPTDFMEEIRYSTTKRRVKDAVKVYGVLWGIKNMGDRKVSNTMRSAFSSVVKNVKKNVIEDVSKRYITKKLLPGILESLNAVRYYEEEPKPLVIASANPASFFMKCVIGDVGDLATNDMVYNRYGFLDHVDINIRDGVDKMEVAIEKMERLGVDSYDCLGIFNGKNDKPLAERCKVVWTNRWADKEIKNLDNVCVIDDYMDFARRLQQEMPPVLQA